MNIGAIFSDLRDSTPGFYPRPQQIALAKRVAEIAERSIQETPDHVLLAVEAVFLPLRILLGRRNP